ncbi:hypothetical protein [Streptomyces iconiensis]|uniref:Integral membrane protein n=1 Tax=Streptomyces iconiensis TaxID=1384038 RepID=A0ABT7A5R0_9ACTN|nr:hypothetical protein [Streptomyces iconiensis]MDJ1136664.1 hypothetical protein [Streptomyces iconiensis]
MTAHHGPADPVCELLYQHRELCERAVDPLEIAAVLEARGVTDRTAARFKHRDVFSLAEELYARVPHTGPGAVGGVTLTADGGQVAAAEKPRAVALGHRPRPAPAALLPLLPGALCGSTLGVLALVRDTPSYARFAVAAVGAVAVCAGVRMALRALPLPKPLVLCACWLFAYALFGDWLLGELLGGGPDIPSATPVALPHGVPLTLALAFAPALWCARGFSHAALRGLTGSRSLEEFAAAVRPLLAAAVALFAGFLLALQWAVEACTRALGRSGAVGGPAPTASAATTCLALLLFAALLLTAHGFGGVASAGLATACAGEAGALMCVLAARLPGLDVLGRPVERGVALLGTPAVPLVACGCAALGLLAYACTALTRASAHHREAAPT